MVYLMMFDNKTNYSDILHYLNNYLPPLHTLFLRRLTHPAMQVPYESLRRTTRDRKYALDAIDAQLQSLQGDTGVERTREEHATLLDSVIKEMHILQHTVS